MIISREDVNWVFERVNGRCFYCGMRLERSNYGLIDGSGAWEICNFVPVLPEAKPRRDNLVPACIICETVKGELYPWEFDARRFRPGDECPNNYMLCFPSGLVSD
jgi:hypothetical protein